MAENGMQMKTKDADNISNGSGPRRVDGEKTTWTKAKEMFMANLMVILLFIGMLAGLALGLCIRQYHPEFGKDPRKTMYLEFCGKLFMRMIKMIILPLILSSLISGMAALPGQARGKLGGLAVAYYLLTTFLSVLLGILLVMTIQPGNRGARGEDYTPRQSLLEPSDALLDLVRNVFPDNLIKACFVSAKTSYPLEEYEVIKQYNKTWLRLEPNTCTMGGVMMEVNKTVDTWNPQSCMMEMITTLVNETVQQPVGTMKNVTEFVTEITTQQRKTGAFKNGEGPGVNVLGIVVFSIVFGLIIGNMGEQGLPLKNFFDSMLEAIIRMVKLIIWFAPIGICFLLAARIVRMDDPVERFKELGFYMMTVLLGLCIHGWIILPLIYFALTRKNPFKLLYHMSQALVFAWGTASSSSTLPITIMCATEKHDIDKRVARFVLPVGATINMDGTALYEAVASIFIAQYLNYQLDAAQVVIVSLTATAAAIGAAGVPEAGLVTMAIVLTAVGLPVESAGLIYAIDWFLDRFRTAVNVWGDSVGAGILCHLTRNSLDDPEDQYETPIQSLSGKDNKAYEKLDPKDKKPPVQVLTGKDNEAIISINQRDSVGQVDYL